MLVCLLHLYVHGNACPALPWRCALISKIWIELFTSDLFSSCPDYDDAIVVLDHYQHV